MASRIFCVFVKFAESDCVFIFLGKWLQLAGKYIILQPNRKLTMSKYQIPYTNACIRAFGRRFKMTTKDAFQYLYRFKGIAFLVEFYEIEHLQSIEDAVDDLVLCCQNNGGYLA